MAAEPNREDGTTEANGCAEASRKAAEAAARLEAEREGAVAQAYKQGETVNDKDCRDCPEMVVHEPAEFPAGHLVLANCASTGNHHVVRGTFVIVVARLSLAGAIRSTAEPDVSYRLERDQSIDAHREVLMQLNTIMTSIAPLGSAAWYKPARQRRAWYAMLVAICLPLGLLACAQVPVAELSTYRAAFDQAQTTSQEVLVDFDRTIVESKQRVKDKEGEPAWQPFPTDWTQVVAQGADATDPDTRVRVQAFEVIKRYNDALGRLAEGKSATELSASIGSLADSAVQVATLAGAAVAPPLVALGPLLSEWAAQLEKARLANEFRKALLQGAPIVNKMLDILIADAGSHYNMRAVLSNEKRGTILSATRKQLRVLIALLKSHAAPAAQFDSLDKISKQVNTVLAPMGKDLPEYPFTFQSAAAATPPAPAFDNDTAAAVAATTAELQRLASSYEDVRKQMESLAVVLLNYQKLLMETKGALAALQKAQVDQASLANVVKEFVSTGFELRRAYEQYRLAVAQSQ